MQNQSKKLFFLRDIGLFLTAGEKVLNNFKNILFLIKNLNQILTPKPKLEPELEVELEPEPEPELEPKPKPESESKPD